MKSCPEAENRTIHGRDIRITTSECGSRHLLVEGELREERRIPYSAVSGERRDPHTVHHMVVRLRVNVKSLTVEEAEAVVHQAPHSECPATVDSIRRLEGMKIQPGFSGRVRRAIGGVNGCTHLTALVLAMAPAVVQGFWVHRMQGEKPVEPSEDLLDRYLVDSCRVWRKDGALAARFRSKGV